MPKITPLTILIFVLGAAVSGYLAAHTWNDSIYFVLVTIFWILVGGLVSLVLFQIINPLFKRKDD